ncbi:MAG TPA: hypothetical protein VLE91_03840 [Candidatus Saccharimonadales bacterium]|nr:hypothetical protein [Candidatus Saccharimonadales bacterium]
MRKRRGQILILVLLVVVVALAVGLSVASRNIINVRTSTQTENSQRAFSAAEGGVEDTLSQLNTLRGNANIQSTGVDRTVTLGNITANVHVQAANTYQQVVDEGSVAQIDLKGPPVASGNILVEWASCADTNESTNPASVEIVQVTGTGPYAQTRTAYAGVSGRSGETGFASPSTSNGCASSGSFAKAQTIAVGANPVVLRIRPFWSRTTLRVSAASGGVLPIQTYDVTSSAKTDLGISRKVQVKRTALPQLPAAFDYVLFSENSIAK